METNYTPLLKSSHQASHNITIHMLTLASLQPGEKQNIFNQNSVRNHIHHLEKNAKGKKAREEWETGSKIIHIAFTIHRRWPSFSARVTLWLFMLHCVKLKGKTHI